MRFRTGIGDIHKIRRRRKLLCRKDRCSCYTIIIIDRIQRIVEIRPEIFADCYKIAGRQGASR